MFGLNKDNEKFLNHLESGESYELPKRNKTSILIKIGNIFFDDINSGEVFMI